MKAKPFLSAIELQNVWTYLISSNHLLLITRHKI